MTHVWDDPVPREGAVQMALDEALRARAAVDGTIVLRLYRWSRDTVSFGANEAARRHWSRPALEADAVPCIRRPTGGRAVWHAAEDLTYAWTGPVAVLGGQRPAYAALHRELAEALAPAVGATALAESPARMPGLGPGACFDVPVGGEVLVQGRKVIGSAQLLRGDTLLQHGALALRPHGDRLAAYALLPREPAEAGPPLAASAEDLAAAIVAAWRARGAVIAPPELTRWAEQVSVEGAERFRDPAWTWRR